MLIAVRQIEGIKGDLTPPPSKFYTQFSVALATVCEGKSEIRAPLSVADTTCLLTSVEKLGGVAKKSTGKWVIWGTAGRPSPTVGVVDAKNSATGLSLLSSICSLAGRAMVVTGDSQLRSRPIPEFLHGLRKIGVNAFSTKENDSPPLVIMGANLKGGQMTLEVSDKYLPALVLPCLFGRKDYHLKVVGGERLRITIALLKDAGVCIKLGKMIKVERGVPLGFRTAVPRDPDLLAPFITLAVLTESRLKMIGEGKFLSILKSHGIKTETKKGRTVIEGPQRMKPLKIDVSDIPQFFPFFCTLACFAKGTSVFFGLSAARTSKSDRVSVMVEALRKMGAKIEQKQDKVLISGPCSLKGSEVDAGGDPCTAASLIIAGSLAAGETLVHNAVYSLRTTYPSFLGLLRKLGGEIFLR
jgi:3-phosphoshikimate 1-carboxyvinyltransferase